MIDSAFKLDLDTLHSDLDATLSELPDDGARQDFLAAAHAYLADQEELVHLGRARIARALCEYPELAFGGLRDARARMLELGLQRLHEKTFSKSAYITAMENAASAHAAK